MFVAPVAAEAWAEHHLTVRKHLGFPENEMLFCGMAVGYRDPDAPINALVSDRAPLEEVLQIHGAKL